MKNSKIFLILTFVFIGLFLVNCRKEKSRICELYSEPVGYAIGTVESLYSVPTRVTYIYSYSVDGANYEGKEKAYGIGQKNSTMIGKKFVVVYSLKDPSNSDLNTNFYIGSESDFTEFTVKYADAPPPPDFPSNCD